MSAQLSARDLVSALYDRRVFIISVTVFVTVLAAVRELVLSGVQYEAETILAVTEPTFAERGLSELVPEPIHTRSYADLLESTTVLGEVHERLVKGGVWEEDEIPELNDFTGNLRLRVVTVDQTTRPVNYSPFLTLFAKSFEADVARRIVSEWADVAIEVARDTNHARVAPVVETLREQEARYRDELNAVLNKLAQDEAEWNTTLLEAQMVLRGETIEQLKAELVQQQLALAANGAGLAAMREKLDGVEPTVQLFRAPSNDVFWLKEGEIPRSDDPEEAAQGMLDQAVNDVYVALRTMEGELVREQAYADAAAESLLDDIETLEEDRAELQQELASHRSTQREFTTQAAVAEEAFAEVAALRALAEAAASLSSAERTATQAPIGLNRVGEKVFIREDRSFLSGRVVVLAAAATALILSCAYVIVARFGLALLEGLGTRSSNN